MKPERKNLSDSGKEKKSSDSIFGRIDRSALLTIVGVIVLFSGSIAVTLIAPQYIDSTWTSPSSAYQVQMYEIEDPNIYIGRIESANREPPVVRRLENGYTLSAFREEENLKIIAPEELETYVTRLSDFETKLTGRLLFLREVPEKATADIVLSDSPGEKKSDESEKKEKPDKKRVRTFELYDPGLSEAFSLDPEAGIIANWIDEKFKILDKNPEQPHHRYDGVVYVRNPTEFRFTTEGLGEGKTWRYDPNGRPLKNLEELKSPAFGFHSRKELISAGEHLYAIEGCWYCHTDQTRTLIQDTVSNGCDAYPAPPSSANEYIYQKITFPGTRRIGPDISRVGVKRPSRVWHESHFWDPKGTVPGSIMSSFRHFFDKNRSDAPNPAGIGRPNERFEAIYQYLMTKGTRITSPTQAWWLGKDPVNTIEIIQETRKSP